MVPLVTRLFRIRRIGKTGRMATPDDSARIALRLALSELPVPDGDLASTGLIDPVLARQRELSRRLSDRYCPVDQRVQDFLDRYLGGDAPRLPRNTLVLDEPGLARELSLPHGGDHYRGALVDSYRVANGVLHNPANDRRTTAGVFHIAEGGLPVPDDKKAVPADVFAGLLSRALRPPRTSMLLPYTADTECQAATFVSLLLRPLVVPAHPGHSTERSMEIRFIVPGALVSNLDFVESIFGNGGDPFLPENDAALDPAGWTGHTGCVILAPHLTSVTKRSLGLPPVSEATERQRRDGMCWENPNELYNDGKAFKVCARDASGVIVTVIADNYFGYCKKEVKTQIGFSANLSGFVEEEHAGGALVFPSYNVGREYAPDPSPRHSLTAVVARDPQRFTLQPEGHALDAEQPSFVLVPNGARYDVHRRTVAWEDDRGITCSIPLLAGRTHFSPDGYRVRLAQLSSDPRQWTLLGTGAYATVCHKPATVSGGGKSEISKAISDAFVYGNAYVYEFADDMDAVQAVLDRDLSDRFADPELRGTDHRSILSFERSIGSVVKALTPSEDFTDEYNEWLASVPNHIKELVFVLKSQYRRDWGADWRSHLSVGLINGRQGNALRLDGDKLVLNMLRVGFSEEGLWRLFGLRPDFAPAVKVQTEDDITASTTVPAELARRTDGLSRKVVENCERQLFQRPDDAVIRGYDTQAEADIAGPGVFLSNFEPLTREDAVRMRDDAIGLSAFSAPMRELVERVAADGTSWFVSSADPRLVDGKPSKNPRYLQQRPDLADPVGTAASDLAVHLVSGVSVREPAPRPVDVVVAGRRNNPPEPGVPALCAFGPLHYLELPELFMEFISSMTGKSPSTTGAGSEGALTKAPFNALPAAVDLNAAFLSYVLSGYDGWISSAGYLGPRIPVAHDVSLLVPEVFSRMSSHERESAQLIANGFLEKVEDFEYEGRTVPASLLGYRITQRFATIYFGRIFTHPEMVFTPEMLRPELQDLDVFVQSIDVSAATHRRVARAYFEDGTVDLACPPLRGLLEVMADGRTREGWTLTDPRFREQFTRDAVLASDWYAERVQALAGHLRDHTARGVAALESFVAEPGNAAVTARLGLGERLSALQQDLARYRSPGMPGRLIGTLGRQPRFDLG